MTWEPYWQWWLSMIPDPVPEAEPSLWDIEKARNRLQRMTEKIESRRWLPSMANRLNGKALRELRAAHDLLRESGRVLTEVRE